MAPNRIQAGQTIRLNQQVRTQIEGELVILPENMELVLSQEVVFDQTAANSLVRVKLPRQAGRDSHVMIPISAISR